MILFLPTRYLAARSAIHYFVQVYLATRYLEAKLFSQGKIVPKPRLVFARCKRVTWKISCLWTYLSEQQSKKKKTSENNKMKNH